MQNLTVTKLQVW